MKRPALTLVEVVAALALLATVVSWVLVAQARSMQQLRQADERRKAAELAEALWTQWQLENVKLDSADEGSFPEEGWTWQRRVSRERMALAAGPSRTAPDMLRIRLTISRSGPAQPVREQTAVEWVEPVPRKSP